MTAETDPSLIGGVEIRAGDLVIDGSVRGKLHKLATELQFERETAMQLNPSEISELIKRRSSNSS